MSRLSDAPFATKLVDWVCRALATLSWKISNWNHKRKAKAINKAIESFHNKIKVNNDNRLGR